MSVRFGDRGETVPVVAARANFSSTGVEMDLIPQGRLVYCTDRRVYLREATFHILNFPEFFSFGEGSSDLWYRTQNGGGNLLGRLMLTHGDWSIEIQALPLTSELVKQLKTDGGSAITHVGRVTRSAGRAFTGKALEERIHGLHLFLSFARGHYCGVFGIIGTTGRNTTVYEDWSTRLSTPWEPRLGWFDVHDGRALEHVYPGFVALLADPQLGEAIARALYWYLRSNRGGDGAGVDSGLLLSQAALERLSDAVLRKRGLVPSGFAGERIRQALKHLGLPVAIPLHSKALSAGRRRKAWNDGPEAIVKIRNELVHPKKRLKVSLGTVIPEGWQLAQWYIELIVLRLCGYYGPYSNRLNPGWIGHVEQVPWKTD